MSPEILFSFTVIGTYKEEKIHVITSAVAIDDLAACIGLERICATILASLPDDHPFRKKYESMVAEMHSINSAMMPPVRGEG